jgi:hypothetical protein
MYKTAGRLMNGGGTSRIEEEVEQEYKESGKVSLPSGNELAQAGLRPGTKHEFVERIISALRRFVNDGCQESAQLAAELNRAGIANNLGSVWTSRLVKLFDERYSRLNVRF